MINKDTDMSVQGLTADNAYQSKNKTKSKMRKTSESFQEHRWKRFVTTSYLLTASHQVNLSMLERMALVVSQFSFRTRNIPTICHVPSHQMGMRKVNFCFPMIRARLWMNRITLPVVTHVPAEYSRLNPTLNPNHNPIPILSLSSLGSWRRRLHFYPLPSIIFPA